MSAGNFPAFLGFAWRPNFDSPADGFHVTPGDTGGGTKGGVIEATWAGAVQSGLVSGTLASAPDAALSLVLRQEFWGDVCDALPPGLDFLFANGRMMSGRFPWLFQGCLGFIGEDVDGRIGPESLAAARSAEPVTLIKAITGVHYAYLQSLTSWHEFGNGWTARLIAAAALACKLAGPVT